MPLVTALTQRPVDASAAVTETFGAFAKALSRR